ncbi:MAG: peptidoglycan-binding protein [Ruminococcus sp.]|nr:peptidoglycan-binding protein [Ruminococcus sp.]
MIFVKRHLKKILTISLALIILASVCLAGTISSHASGTGAGLAEWALNAYYSHWSYVYGGATPGAVDCSGLIYSYCGGERCSLEYVTPEIGYVRSGIPRVHGLGLHQPGHFGVYIGDGMAVDARDESSGVCYDSVSGKSWVEWFKVAACTYITNGWEQFNGNYYYYENGEYVVNTSREIGGVTYNFNSSGASDKTPEDMNAVANSSGGSSSGSGSSKKSTDSSSDSGSDDEDTSESTKSNVLKVGSSGDDVTKLQNRLAELGFYDGEVTGYFGDATEAAYKKFQKAAGLNPDGIAGEDELQLLYSDDAPSAKAEKKNDEEEEKDDGVYTIGDMGDKVTAIQQQLTDLGYYSAEITGYFGEVTEQAVKDFQTVNGIEVTGVVDEFTYEVLFSEGAVANTVEETEEETEEVEEVQPETEPATEQVVEQPKTISEIAGDNLAVAQKVVVKTNRLTKNALKSYDEKTVEVTANGKNNSNFLIWMFVVLAIAAAATGFMFINGKRKAAYSGARVKGEKKKPEVPVRYW